MRLPGAQIHHCTAYRDTASRLARLESSSEHAVAAILERVTWSRRIG